MMRLKQTWKARLRKNFTRPPIVLRRVSGQSMSPHLKEGSLVVGVRRSAIPKVGDVVILNHQGIEKIKRVAAVKSDKMTIIGDNKTHSTDSRTFGDVPLQSRIATVIYPRTP